MVGWSRRAREASEAAERAAARERACIDGGCKCYCHVPKNHVVRFPGILLAITAVWLIFTVFAVRSCEREQAAHPPEPYVCNGITSTGAPSDCHPAVLPPEVLKRYEDQFKRQ